MRVLSLLASLTRFLNGIKTCLAYLRVDSARDMTERLIYLVFLIIYYASFSLAFVAELHEHF